MDKANATLETIADGLCKDRFEDLALMKAYWEFFPRETIRNDNNRNQGGFRFYSPYCRFART